MTHRKSTIISPNAALLCVAVVVVLAGRVPAQQNDAPSKSSKAILLEQGWTDQERLQYYFTSQGSAAVPYDIFVNLEEAVSPEMFRSERVSVKHGLIPHAIDPNYNPDGLPIGIAKASVPGGRWKGDWIGVTCAACHTGQLQYKGTSIRVDGGKPNFDFNGYIKALGEALKVSLQNPAKFDRLTRRLGLADGDSIDAFRGRLAIAAQQVSYYSEVSSAAPHPFGPGRMDAVTVIHNRVLGNALGVPENTVSSLIPTKAPFLWNAPQSTWVQWTAFGRDPLNRNSGESLGAFVKVDLTSNSPDEGLFDSTIDLAGQLKLERLLRKLAPPQWPESVLGEIDGELADRGKSLFIENCAECHSVYPHRWSEPKLKGKRFIENALVPFDVVGTDPMQAAAPQFDPQPKYRPGNMAQYLPEPYRGRSLVPEGEIFEVVKDNVIKKALTSLELTEDLILDAIGYSDLNERGPVQPVYKAGPRDGIWAVPPYLHNGSVPSLYDLLSPAAERPTTFFVGRDFDPVRVGIDTSGKSGKFVFDTHLIGNSNSGHSFEDGPRKKGVIGRLLSEDERWELIAYLKSIPNEPAQATPYGGPEDPIEAWKDKSFFHNLHGNGDVYQGGYRSPGENQDPGGHGSPEEVHSPKLGQEVMEANEEELISSISQLTLEQLKAKVEKSKGPARRTAHAKTHGLVRAEFIVVDDLPGELRHGVFAEPLVFDALIRFSASLGDIVPDTFPQPRGMAIKLLGVEGKKLLEDEQDARTQDFVMINHPTFFIGNLKDYREFTWAQKAGMTDSFLKDSPEVAQAIAKMSSRPANNPIQIRYWSQTPYRLGPNAIKFSARPISRRANAEPADKGPEVLREAVVDQVGREDTYFEFLVQVQTDPVAEPIENPTIEWAETANHFRRVALIRIPKQDISGENNLRVAEHLSFTPWHTLPEHRPLGAVNRARRVVYRTISEFRHQFNEAERAEPTELPRELAK